jgi:hypothetical protein
MQRIVSAGRRGWPGVIPALNDLSKGLKTKPHYPMPPMEQYDDTFETVDAPPTIKEIEKRLRKLGCTKEQVSRHLDQVTKSRTAPVSEKRNKNRQHKIDWP